MQHFCVDFQINLHRNFNDIQFNEFESLKLMKIVNEFLID